MEQFSYSFAVSMLHSIWQMAVLLVFYFILTAMQKKSHPGFKRNILFGLLGLQLCTTILTFVFYFASSLSIYENKLAAILSEPFFIQLWMQSCATSIFYTYSLIIACKIAALVFHSISFKSNYTKHLIKPAVGVKMFAISKAYQFGIKRKIRIWYSSKVFTPLTFGFLKPVILMPIALINSLTIKETEALIIHELTHIKNNDYLLNWLLLITETIYFFNPFVKIIAGKIKLEREKSCDAQVIQFNYPSLIYAETLLKIARQTQHCKRFQLAAVINQSQLLQRIHFFSSKKNQQFRKNNNSIFSITFMLAVFVFNIFMLTHIKNKNNTTAAINSFAAEKTIIKSVGKDNFKTENIIASNKEKSPKTNIKRIPAKSVIIKKIKLPYLQQVNNLEDHNYALPANFKIQEPVITKEVLLNEENSSGRTVTKAYKVQLKNGQWIVEPLWMTTEIKPGKDSLKQKADTLYHIIDPVQ